MTTLFLIFGMFFCYSCNFYSCYSCLSLRKEETRPIIRLEIPQDLSLWRSPACQILLKAVGISSATARVAPDLLKALTILSDTTLRKSTVDQEDLKLYWKSEKSHIPLRDQQSYYLEVFQRLF